MKAAAKDGWHAKPLEEIATFSNGLWKGKKGPFRKAKVLRSTNFRLHGVISFDDIAEIDVECKQFDKRRLRSGDLILERSGGGPNQPVGRVVLFKLEDNNYSFRNFTSIIRVADQSRLDPRFLHQVLNWWYSAGWTEQIQSRSTGIRNLDFKAYKQFLVPLPPLEEQRRIVAVLDETFEGLDRARVYAEANLQDARELFESTLNRVFAERGWCTAPLDALAHKDCSLSYGIVQPGDEVPDGLPLVRPTNLTRRTVDLGGLKRIDPDRAASYGRTTLVGGELLLCVRGSTGTVSLAAEELCGGNVTRGIVPVRFDSSKIDIRFGYYQFISKYVQNQIAEKTYGAAIMQINIRDLRKLNLFGPSLEEQYSEVEKLEAIEREHDHLCRACQKRLVDLDELRQSIVQRAFAGELT